MTINGVEITDKVREDIYNTRAFWFDAMNPEKGIREKEDWKEYDKIKNLWCGCAFCQYFECDVCGINCVCGFLYTKWCDSETIEEVAHYAKQMFETIDGWMKDNNI